LRVVAAEGAGQVGDRGDQVRGADYLGQLIHQGSAFGQGLGRYGCGEVLDEFAEHIGADLGDDVVQGGEVVEDRAAADPGTIGELVHAEGGAAGGVHQFRGGGDDGAAVALFHGAATVDGFGHGITLSATMHPVQRM